MSTELNPSLATSPVPQNKTAFMKDYSVSLVVSLVALPLCMGIAMASGMPPAAGLVTGIIGGLIVGSIAGSPLQVSGLPALNHAISLSGSSLRRSIGLTGKFVLAILPARGHAVDEMNREPFIG
jgi:MFS superfamily sulfate permease-like transporter